MSWYRSRSRFRGGFGYGGFAPYVPVATRKANAAKHAQKLAKKDGRELEPVKITGRNMATTYWGTAWCDNLEAYSDYANRLPRGRTYARNGSVIDLQIKKGKVEAIVSGSQIYTISITIETLAKPSWNRLKAECSESITSLIDLLQGRFDEGVMQRLAHPTEGLFPRPKEIKMSCSCPDSAGLCKHLAAVLYGVGNRLDNSPELLFTLRNVDHLELVSQAVAEGNLDRTLDAGDDCSLAGSDLGEMFGIDIEQSEAAPKKTAKRKRTEAENKPAATKKPPRKTTAKPKAAKAKASPLKATKQEKAADAALRRKPR
ncbi:MAG TPA: SWIM zinc finger family protein [Gemmataceae bacterium]|nr:SWIM zinc finger family protein [Gemmataceae bacterium]